MIKQNTPEWEKLRKTKIGASDAPIIMGTSPWKTKLQLWNEKMGLTSSPPVNRYMARGHAMEEEARLAYCKYMNVEVQPQVVFHSSNDWMMASLDGLSEDRKVVVEIKCPGEKDHQVAKNKKIPKHYYAQLQHQLAVIDQPMLHYFSYTEENFYLVEVERDDSYIESLIEKELDFWKSLQNFQPPSTTDEDYVEMHSHEWNQAVNNWASVKVDLDVLKEKEKEYREQLIKLADGKNVKGCGVKVKKSHSKGSIDYGSIPMLQGIDLEKYRKKTIEKWSIYLSKRPECSFS